MQEVAKPISAAMHTINTEISHQIPVDDNDMYLFLNYQPWS